MVAAISINHAANIAARQMDASAIISSVEVAFMSVAGIVMYATFDRNGLVSVRT